MRYFVISILVLSLLLSGCARNATPNAPSYECPDGRNVSDYSLCYNQSYGEEAGNATKNETQQTNYGASGACEDSDGGKALHARGTTSLGEDEELDFCIDETVLREYYCDSGNISYDEISCPQGEKCINGQCVSESCWDSDGIDAYSIGAVHKGEETYEDSCKDEDSVKEYYCDGNYVKDKTIDCGEGESCQGGRCTSGDACVDSDGGKVRETRGTTFYVGNSHTDECINDNELTEYYCDGKEVKSTKLICGIGYECSNGECIPLACVDSDGGHVLEERGVVKVGLDEEEDVCTDEGKIKEYFCEDDQISHETLECPSDTQCVEGECIELDCTSEETEFEEENVLHELMALEGTIRLYEGELLEADNGRILRVESVSGDVARVELYESYFTFIEYGPGEDEICTDYLFQGEIADVCSELWFEHSETGYDMLEFELNGGNTLNTINGTGTTNICQIQYYNSLEITTGEEFEVTALWRGFPDASTKNGGTIYYIPPHNVSIEGTNCSFGWDTGGTNPSPILILNDGDDNFVYDFYSQGATQLSLEYPPAGNGGLITFYDASETTSKNDEIWIIEEAGEREGIELVSAMGIQIVPPSPEDEDLKLGPALVEETVQGREDIGFLWGKASDIGTSGDILSNNIEGYNWHVLVNPDDRASYRYMDSSTCEEDFVSPRGTEFFGGSDSKYRFEVPTSDLEFSTASYDFNLEVMGIEETDDAYIEIELEGGAHLAQYTTSKIRNTTWTGPSDCEENETQYLKQTIFFYPRIDTVSSGVNFDFESFSLFDTWVQLEEMDIDEKMIYFDIDGDEFTVDSYYNTFEFKGEEYEMELVFSNVGLAKIVVQPE